MKQPKITVVGSINMDLMTTISRIPNQGETNFGDSFTMKPGGKGANQAIAAARLGGDVSLVGKVGADAMGEELVTHLKQQQINTDAIGFTANRSTGIANILLNEKDNRIMVVRGANEEVTVEYVQTFQERLKNSDIVLAQLEIPPETAAWCAEFCTAHGVSFILNPAPAVKMSEQIWRNCSYITPNEEEAKLLFSKDSYADKLITTLGPEGAGYQGKVIPAISVKVADTTGAGDTFNGALAYYTGAGFPIEKAIAYANTASSFAIEKLGAQEGMPKAEEVEQRYLENV
ncbi:ribokinase [Halobacillus sp. A1]|uniref:ribokinase n=1 Tax=Halobacillus sp. A1 TaxID=2880262 RepID=UPI0020A64069|nr:ribokinase [Halobacillus sp. A1]MCP3030845.1 ribokinase [Halobacillus sp. A1]